MAAWIKIPLGTEVRLGLCDILLDGDPAPLPQRGTAPIFGPYLLRPNGCMDQDVTWYGARPRPSPNCVKWGPSSPSPKGAQPPPIFGPYVLRPNGYIDQDATLYGRIGLGPGDFVIDREPVSYTHLTLPTILRV